MSTHHNDEYNGQPDLSVRPYTATPDQPVKRGRKKQPSNASTGLIVFLLLALITFIAFKIWQGGFGITGSSVGNLTTNAISNMSFNGTVTDFKYNNDKLHTKVALLSDGSTYTIYTPWMYYISTGDTLIKTKGSLQIKLHRPGKKADVLDYAPILRKLELTGKL